MKPNDLQISHFFLSMLKHEIVNGVNNLYQLGMSGIDDPNLAEDIRQDLKYDHLEAFDLSQIALNKLHTLLYTQNIAKAKKTTPKQVFDIAKKSLPLNPTKINFDEASLSANYLYPTEVTIQILFGIFQLIIRNEHDSFDNGINIRVSISDTGAINLVYSGVNKSALFQDLSNNMIRFQKKSKLALEYEFLRHLISREVIELTSTESCISVKLMI